MLTAFILRCCGKLYLVSPVSVSVVVHCECQVFSALLEDKAVVSVGTYILQTLTTKADAYYQEVCFHKMYRERELLVCLGFRKDGGNFREEVAVEPCGYLSHNRKRPTGGH